MKFKKLATVVAMSLIPLMVVDSAMAAFGRGSSSGVSRSYSRPSSSSSSSSYSKPSSTYSKPSSTSSYSKPQSSYTAPSRPAASSNYNSNNYNRQQPSYNSGYQSNNYGGNNGYNGNQRQRSTMGDIGVGVAGVAGGILAAQAITSLISSPGHAGLYTHPQYPGQYFNAQGVPQSAPQSAPVQQAAPAQQQYIPEQQYGAPQVVQQQQLPQVVYQQAKSEPGFFSILWSALFGVLHLIFFGLVVAGLGFFGFRMFRKGKKMIADQKHGDGLEAEKADLSDKAQQIFYGIQGNSNNKTYLAANTKYLPVNDMMDEPSEVIQFEQGRVDVALEFGKVRGSVYYRATLKKPDGTVEKIREYWNFEKDGTVWKLIGIDQA